VDNFYKIINFHSQGWLRLITMVMSTKTFEGANLGLPLRCQLLAPVCHDSKLLWDISHDFLDIVQDDPQSDPSIALSELLQGAVQAHPAGFFCRCYGFCCQSPVYNLSWDHAGSYRIARAFDS